MHPKVRDLYKRFVIAGRAYPQGLPYVRQRVKAAFRQTPSHTPSGLTEKVKISSEPAAATATPSATDALGHSSSSTKPSNFISNSGTIMSEEELNKALAKGRYWVRELHAITALHKYRQMKKRYGSVSTDDFEVDVSASEEDSHSERKS